MTHRFPWFLSYRSRFHSLLNQYQSVQRIVSTTCWFDTSQWRFECNIGRDKHRATSLSLVRLWRDANDTIWYSALLVEAKFLFSGILSQARLHTSLLYYHSLENKFFLPSEKDRSKLPSCITKEINTRKGPRRTFVCLLFFHLTENILQISTSSLKI